jgi:hypothetical protein
MVKNGEGKDTAQRVAICNSRAFLSDEDTQVIAHLWNMSEEAK